MFTSRKLTRRQFVTGLAAGASLLGLSPGRLLANKASGHNGSEELAGNRFDLSIGNQKVNFTGRERLATTVNNSLPAPVLRWRQGETVTLNVTNRLPVDSSIHWHGIILPSAMDGVPGISSGFDGIKPGETFTYRFKLNQSGTYWYHSHSGFQEQTGMYGAIVVEPAEPEPFSYDRDYVVLLSDWTDEDPQDVYHKLKKQSHYYNFNERTAGDLWRDIKQKGIGNTMDERAMWNHMRMSESDLSDVTGYTYTFLMNGHAPVDGWTGLFEKGDRVLLRFINAAAMTIFDVRIPGLKMTVIASDGQYIEPVTIEEFRIGVAETYDVIIEPDHDSAYCVFAQSIDRSGFARGTLTPDPGMSAEVPEPDPVQLLSHADMGMGMMMDMSDGEHAHHHHGHQMGGMIEHKKSEFGPHVDMRADNPQLRLDDPGVGLRGNGRHVLTYADIFNLYPTPDPREPSREIELHLTGNMSRYMWSIDGIKFADAEPIVFKYGERLRITLVNDTMMNHPIHLHGMWSDLETGDNKRIPRKHTVIVQPGSKISYLVTADARGGWAYHCHLLYHMLGMFRRVDVV